MNKDNLITVHWIVDGIVGSEQAGYSSTLASNRYRAILPAQGLRALGHDARIVDMSQWDPMAYPADRVPQVVVIGKLLPGPRFETLQTRLFDGIQAARRRGIKVLADISDDHFDHPLLGAYWAALVRAADAIVAGSEAMAEIVRRHGGSKVFVVGDPVAAPYAKPRAYRRETGLRHWLMRVLSTMGFPPPPLRLIWYGNPTNWPSLIEWMPQLVRFAQDQPWVLTVVSRAGAGIEQFVHGFNSAGNAAARMEFREWSEAVQWEAVEEADLVLLPSNLDKQKNTVKTANRLVDALQSGRFVIAAPVPAYQPLSEYAWLGLDPVAGIRWALDNPEKVLDKIQRGQEYVQAHHSLDAITRRWVDVLGRLPVNEHSNTYRLGLKSTAPSATMLKTEQTDQPVYIDKPSACVNHDPVHTGQSVCDNYLVWYYNTQVWKRTFYHGIRTLKLPTDMWNYQEIIFERGIAYVIETGTRHGGSALFFADTLEALGGDGFVISIDVDTQSRKVQSHPRIRFLQGDSGSVEMVEQVKALLPPNRKPVFLILDSDHSMAHVLRELEVWVPFLNRGDYLVVEDTNVNGHPVRPDHGPGPWEAIHAYLAAHVGVLAHDFERERKFGVTSAPYGYYYKL